MRIRPEYCLPVPGETGVWNVRRELAPALAAAAPAAKITAFVNREAMTDGLDLARAWRPFWSQLDVVIAAGQWAWASRSTCRG